MRSTLKKSLYLGLAALSFASVAGAANNADAAKKTKPAKTYATASYQNIPDQGQSNIAYNVTGTNALFNKPGTVKGAKQVASKATMSDLASSKQNFMVYQNATTSRGSKYIKVVSFDKKYRGWIYAGNNTSAGYGTGVQQINLTTGASAQYSSVYLSNPGQTALKNSPEGSQFNASQDAFAQTGLVARDKFTVDKAQTINRTGTTWYHLIDQNNNGVQGWVPSNQVQPNSNNYFDASTQVKVNYTSNGNVVKSANVSINPYDVNTSYAGGVLNKAGVADAINRNVSGYNNSGDATSNAANYSKYTNNSPLYNSGFSLASALNGDSSNLNYVTAGSTIDVPVTANNASYGSVASKLSFYQLNGNSVDTLSTNSFSLPSVNATQFATQLNGFNSHDYVNMDRVLGTNEQGYKGTNDNGNTTKKDQTYPNYNDDSSNRSHDPVNFIDVANGHFNYGDSNIFKANNNVTSPNQLGILFGGTQKANYNITNAYTTDNDAVNDATPGNTTPISRTTINSTDSFHYDYVLDYGMTKNNNNGSTYGQNVKLYYKVVPVANPSSNNSGTNTSDILGR